ncbi:MAG TPA: ribonuclease J [Xanthobacteraceae bacterium]|nr:ribonuclease J [Xanthobacteraceae bacterium]
MADPHDEFVFAPLGGVGEIGMNLAVYGLGTPRRKTWVAVDFGVSFAGDDLPGVDLIMPNIDFLIEQRKNLAGIVLTHAHEDHFGALFDLWPRIQVPVYATPFTAALIEAKRQSEPGAPEIEVKTIPLGSRFNVGPFDIEFVTVAHSIPESNALIIRTPHGAVLHTGDWKIDPTPLIGQPTDETKLRALGDEGCLAMIGDSTNAVREGRSPSEADVARTLTSLIGRARARVAVTTFASNIARIKAVADAARAADREIVIVGRAMDRLVQVARETGYLDGVRDFRPADAYGYLPPDKVVALCTGSQGEPRAALARIAMDDHPEVTLSRGDVVIFSSRTIPGNEKAVSRVINGLVFQGVEVITDRTHLVHVSGHPRAAEVADMYAWVRPQIAVPVHGEHLHLHEHAKIARAAGVRDVVECQNGDVIRLAPLPHGKVDEIVAGRLYKDGRLIVPAAAPAVSDRRKLSFAGMVSIALVMDGKGEVVDGPEFELIGIPDLNAAGVTMESIVEEAMMGTLDSLPRARRRDPDTVAEALRRAVRAAVAQSWGKKPLCLVHVMTV